MKIIHVINYFQPIVGYQEYFLVKEQMKRHDVSVITSDRYAPILYDNEASKRLLGDRIRGTGIFIECGIKTYRLPVLFEAFSNVWLEGPERKILECSPDAIHIHGAASITSVRIARLRGKLNDTKIIIDDHMVQCAVSGNHIYPLYWLFKQLFSKKIVKNSDELVAVTDETKQFMNNIYGFPLNKIITIPLGCDSTMFHRNVTDRDLLRSKLSVRDDELLFCYAGKIIRDKGVKIFIEAAAHLMKYNNKFKVLCIGGQDDSYFKEILGITSTSLFPNNFIFIPAVPNNELYKYYSAADIGVWPQQCSIAAIEAMACHLPIIISDKCGATDRVTDNNNGFLYREGDYLDLSSKMSLCFDERIRLDMGMRSRKYSEKLDWANISSQFEKLYSGHNYEDNIARKPCHW